MFAKYFVALAAVASSVLAQTINTPASLVVCQPTQISWSAGTSPYFLSVIPGGQPSAAALVDFGQQTGTTYTWTVNLPAGTSITLKLVDSTGATVYSSPVTIQAGSSTSCLTSSAGASATAASPGVTGAVATTSAASSAATSASAAGSSVVASSATHASSASAAASSGVSAKASSASAGASSAASSAAAATSKSAAHKTVAGSFGALLLGALGIVMV